MHPLISTTELASQIEHAQGASPNYLIFDCRFALLDKQIGHREYLAGHIPGAQYADLEAHLSAPAGKNGRHPLPNQDLFVAQLGRWGINKNTTVVCYDQNSGAFAARLWWLLRSVGHHNVTILDGGYDTWLAAELPTTTDIPEIPATTFSKAPSLTRVCQATDILAIASDETTPMALIDARESARFRGEVEPIDPVAGHIPGARNRPFLSNMYAGKFKSSGALAEDFISLGLQTNTDVICYCGSGVTAIHNIIALRLAGFPEPILYPGSWSEWIVDPSRPIGTD